MKLIDFYERVIETTGLDVMTLPSIKAAIKNCMADLTSRGYRIFCEKQLKDFEIRHSYSKKGYPYDNASMESFNAILKKEEVNKKVIGLEFIIK